MIEVGLVDETWLQKLPDVLSIRLKQLLDDPNGLRTHQIPISILNIWTSRVR